MAATVIARNIIVVQILVLGFYSVLSERPMIFNIFGSSNVINICKDKQWQQYHVSKDGNIIFLTADIKQRVLYWITKNAYFSLATDGNKTVVNLSKKFGKGLAYRGFLQRTRTQFAVYDCQIIFAELHWGLMKFDVKTNRKLFSLKRSDIKKYFLTYSILGIDIYDNEACLYWIGPGFEQISRYRINSNINEIVVHRSSKKWTPFSVQQERVYWADYNTQYLFSTNMNLQDKQHWMSGIPLTTYELIGGVMYYSYQRNISSQLLKSIHPLKPYLSPCRIKWANFFVVIPASYQSTNQDVDRNFVKRVKEDADLEDDDVEDTGETGVWSTIGWVLGCGVILLISAIICFRLRLVKMASRRELMRRPNYNTTENIYTMPMNIVNDTQNQK